MAKGHANVLMLVGPRQLEIRKVKLPAVGPRCILVKAMVSGLSHGTEMNLYRGTSPFGDKEFDPMIRAFVPAGSSARSVEGGGVGAYPIEIGYEMVGRLEAIGSEVTEFRVGDIVHTGTPHRDLTVVDIDAVRDFGYPVWRLPSSERVERGILLALTSVALQALHDGRVKFRDAVYVSGVGALGLLTVQMLRLAGACTIVAIDPDARRRELAISFGATSALDPDEANAWRIREMNGGRGYDVAIEFSGTYAGLHAAIASVVPGGTVVSGGFYHGNASDLRLGEEWHHNRIDMVSTMGAWGNPCRAHPMWDRSRITHEACRLLFDGLLATEELTTNLVPFVDAPKAYQELDDQSHPPVKVGLVYAP